MINIFFLGNNPANPTHKDILLTFLNDVGIEMENRDMLNQLEDVSDLDKNSIDKEIKKFKNQR